MYVSFSVSEREALQVWRRRQAELQARPGAAGITITLPDDSAYAHAGRLDFVDRAVDPRTGRYLNADLSEYLVPVNADVPDIEVIFVDEHDPHVNPLGAKGLAELSLVGVAAAVANAVYHATGRRVRDLPITPDKLL